MSIDKFKKIFVVYSEKISIKFNEKQLNQFYNYMDYLVNFGLSNQLVSILARIYSNDDNVNPYLLLDELHKYDSKKYVLKK